MPSQIWTTSTESANVGSDLQVGFTCPVCGYVLAAPPQDFLICVSCGTEFGNDDIDWSHADLRSAWMEQGCKWFSHQTLPPHDWDPIRQVAAVLSFSGNSQLGDAYQSMETQIIRDELTYWEFRNSAEREALTCRD